MRILLDGGLTAWILASEKPPVVRIYRGLQVAEYSLETLELRAKTENVDGSFLLETAYILILVQETIKREGA